jgi:hypothetical protein
MSTGAITKCGTDIIFVGSIDNYIELLVKCVFFFEKANVIESGYKEMYYW